MGRKYKNSPIIEALCEFRFEPGTPWDLTIPGLVYQKIRDDFPIRRQTRQFGFRFRAGLKDAAGPLEPIGRMQFFRQDETALVQVDRHLLTVNHLKPYPTWSDFVPYIRKGFYAYREVASPKGLARVGLRYINRIEIPGKRVELADYFNFRPFLGSELPQDFASFIVGMDLPYENSRDALRVQASTAAGAAPETFTVILDLDYFLAQPGQIPQEAAFDWLQIAHTRIEEVFEACITDRLREMFQEVTA